MTSSDETCAAVEDAFGALLSGEATRAEIRRANRHRETCPACRAAFADLAGFRERWRANYAVAPPRSRRRIAALAGLALAASLVLGLAVARRAEDWRAIVEPPAMPAIETTAVEDDEIWIEFLSDEELEDLVIAAQAP